jgi:hypothetical protein
VNYKKRPNTSVSIVSGYMLYNDSAEINLRDDLSLRPDFDGTQLKNIQGW